MDDAAGDEGGGRDGASVGEDDRGGVGWRALAITSNGTTGGADVTAAFAGGGICTSTFSLGVALSLLLNDASG